MIVVIGSPIHAQGDAPGDARAVGVAAAIAMAAAADGADVQLVGRVGDDRAGDALLLALTARGVRHTAMIRDAGRATRRAALPVPDEGEPLVPLGSPDEDQGQPSARRLDPDVGGAAPTVDAGDLSLALGYLVDPRVVVVAEPLADDGAAVVAEAAAFADATLVAVVEREGSLPAAYQRATVLAAPADDADGAFARLVGRFAAALDAGSSGGEAFALARGADGWEMSGA